MSSTEYMKVVQQLGIYWSKSNLRQDYFFLTENPDKRTYSHLGARFILTSQNGEYSYQVPISPSQEIDKVLEFSPSMTEFVVDQIVRAAISRTQR